MNTCASQSSSFNTNVEDIGLAFPAPFYWANAPFHSCCESWPLTVLSFNSGELPSTQECCLPWKITSHTHRPPKAMIDSDWYWFLPQGGKTLWCSLWFRAFAKCIRPKLDFLGPHSFSASSPSLNLLSTIPYTFTCKHSHNKSNALKSPSQALLLSNPT